MQNKIEIMAPVGSFESLAVAIQAGADSVYFGIDKLNMRARSSVNFTFADLKLIRERCHENGIKTYLTLNTEIYQDDLSLMREIVNQAKENEIDAVIASDIAVIQYANSIGQKIHISTQLNIANYTAVEFWAKFADVMVLARELNLDQVAEISKQIEINQLRGPSGNLIRVEIFAHGALCMAVSGKCYLSLHEFNKSANRGSCYQTCRRGYVVTDKETGYELEVDNQYIMSPKDLKTIHFLDKIIEAGVSVLKIEGRGRSADYVKTVAECYKEAVTAISEGTYTPEKIAEWETQLSRVFNRGFWDGYYLGQKLGEWSSKYGSQATTKKVYIGDVTNYFSKIEVAEFRIRAGELAIGEQIMVVGPTSGIWESTVSELRDGQGNIEVAEKGMVVSIPVGQRLRKADKLYKIVESEN
ncbi:MAG: collagenase-like protease [Ignavibacteriae bacterium HGW-Ignavibacteriae-1]|jgi:putative protease|nr:MAG: collagenase-like protease [Ignavibacteriae bacterium HGW-Ignavibacteriae-1]